MIPDIPKFPETWKGTWYHRTFEEHGQAGKIKIHIWAVRLLTCLWEFFLPVNTWKR